MKYLLLIFVFFLSLACTQSTATNKQTEPQKKVCQNVVANTTILFGVKGMVCQMGCGGSIRKTLKETCAVERVEVTYQDSLEEQTIKVYYNRQKIGPKQMIATLSELNEGQFTVRKLAEPAAIK
jgi:hypothetical protein